MIRVACVSRRWWLHNEFRLILLFPTAGRHFPRRSKSDGTLERRRRFGATGNSTHFNFTPNSNNGLVYGLNIDSTAKIMFVTCLLPLADDYFVSVNFRNLRMFLVENISFQVRKMLPSLLIRKYFLKCLSFSQMFINSRPNAVKWVNELTRTSKDVVDRCNGCSSCLLIKWVQ